MTELVRPGGARAEPAVPCAAAVFALRPGSLPAYLGTLGSLRYVWLNDNFFAGQLPEEWCSGAWWQFRVDNNAGGWGFPPKSRPSRGGTWGKLGHD